mgnify:CR=1 FL=1
MAVVLYIRKEYFRGVTLSDKSAHILEFHYKGQNVDVFDNGVRVFHLEYFLESKFKANILDFYVTDMNLRGKGYGRVCMLEILDQMKKKQVTLIKSPIGYKLAPIGYTGPDQYLALMTEFYEKTGFMISGDGNTAIQILG